MTTPAFNKQELTRLIKTEALNLGFQECGISKAEELKVESKALQSWLGNNFHGEMKYMENHFEKRTDPRNLVPNARSVISFLYNYYPGKENSGEQHYRISKYALGKDYHHVIKKKLKSLVRLIEDHTQSENTRAFVDSAPVMDKVWAVKSGLGWMGKNTCLINRKLGSFFFIGEIITDVELNYDSTKQKDLCGSCNRCIRACPTEALTEPYLLDSNKCISYLTIEYKGENLPSRLREGFDNWIFGCDICQDVCPWNRMAKPHDEPVFRPNELLQKMTKQDWDNLDEEKFSILFKNSAVKRTKISGLKRNIRFVSDNDK